MWLQKKKYIYRSLLNKIVPRRMRGFKEECIKKKKKKDIRKDTCSLWEWSKSEILGISCFIYTLFSYTHTHTHTQRRVLAQFDDEWRQRRKLRVPRHVHSLRTYVNDILSHTYTLLRSWKSITAILPLWRCAQCINMYDRLEFVVRFLSYIAIMNERTKGLFFRKRGVFW